MVRIIIAALALALSPITAASVAAQDVADVAERADRAVGRVLTASAISLGSGSGFVIGEAPGNGRYYFLTNEHVVRGALDLEIGFRNGNGVERYAARILRESRGYDLALLEITYTGTGTHRPGILRVADRELRRGETVFALGFPGASAIAAADTSGVNAFTTTVTVGTISKVYDGSFGSNSGIIELVEHTTLINRGNSGGPLLDRCGHVVGVNTAYIFGDPSGEDINNIFISSSPNAIAEFLAPTQAELLRATTCNPGFTIGSLSQPATIALLATLATALLVAGGVLARSQMAPADGAMRVSRQAGMRKASSRGRSPSKGGGKPVLKLAALEAGLRGATSLSAEDLARGVTLGRHPEADVVLPQGETHGVSRRHAELKITNRQLTITDLGSSNGTTVDGTQLAAHQPRQINTKSVVRLGTAQLSLSRPD